MTFHEGNVVVGLMRQEHEFSCIESVRMWVPVVISVRWVMMHRMKTTTSPATNALAVICSLSGGTSGSAGCGLLPPNTMSSIRAMLSPSTPDPALDIGDAGSTCPPRAVQVPFGHCHLACVSSSPWEEPPDSSLGPVQAGTQSYQRRPWSGHSHQKAEC